MTNMAVKLVTSLLLLLKIHFDTGYAQCVNILDVTAHLDYSGKIKSPNYPNNYNNRAICEWLITANTGVVVVSIDDMLLETNYDYIYLYDGSSSSGTLLGRYTGETTPIKMSSGSTMYVRFTTDSSVTRYGFKLTYFALYSASSSNLHAWPYSPCGTTITISTNDIQQLKLSTAPLSSFPSLSNCEVTFSVSASNLNVTILWSDLAFSSNGLNVTSADLCNQQYGLSIWDGTGSTLLYWLCNADQSPDDTVIIYPTQTSVLFRYNSPISITGPIISIQKYGGAAATATVPIPTTQPVVSSCGDTSMIAESYLQYLTSPNYPNAYSNLLSCTWTITSYDLTAVITLTIISLYTEISHDTLSLYDGPSTGYPLIGNAYSGSYANVILTSTSSYVTLYFSTDYSVTNSGFYISYYTSGLISTPTCATSYSPMNELDASSTEASFYSHATYLSNSYDNGYQQYWLIKKPDISDTLTFYFAAFRLEACSYDTLKVYKGACLSDTLEYTFCGEIDLSEKYTISRGQYVLFQMATDYSVTYSGFELKYYTGDGTDDETNEGGVPLMAIIVPILIVIICSPVVIFFVRAVRKPKRKVTSNVSPPKINNLNNFKLTTTNKVKVPKQKPERKKAAVKPVPSAPPIPPPGPIPQPVPPPFGFQDPAYPPLPQPMGGAAPPMYQPYSNYISQPKPNQTSFDVPNPFVYTPPH